MRSSCAPPVTAMTVLLASLKSVSSVAAQKMGATGIPVASCSAFASASALNALDSVYIGPPKSPGCCPVVTTTPFPAATELNRSFALSGRLDGGLEPGEPVPRRHRIARTRAAARHADGLAWLRLIPSCRSVARDRCRGERISGERLRDDAGIHLRLANRMVRGEFSVQAAPV